MRIWGSAIALLLSWAMIAQAEPLNLKQIPDDAKWLAHFNVDAMRDSTVVQAFYHQCVERVKDAQEHFGKARERIGMDPRSDLHGITLYGSKICKGEGILIVHATVDKELLLKKAEKAPCHEVTDYKDFKIHTWMHRKGKLEHKVAGAFFKDDVLVFGPNVEKVQKALDVLKGDASNLEGKDSPLAQAVPAGTLFVARATALASAEAPCKSPLVKQSKWFSLLKGEREGQWFAEGALLTDSPEVAGQVKQVIEGIRAMALLQHGTDEETQSLINQLKVNVQDSKVAIEFRASVDAVSKKVGKMCDELAKMKEKHRKAAKERKERKLEQQEL